jgi:hypothetical protein
VDLLALSAGGWEGECERLLVAEALNGSRRQNFDPLVRGSALASEQNDLGSLVRAVANGR